MKKTLSTFLLIASFHQYVNAQIQKPQAELLVENLVPLSTAMDVANKMASYILNGRFFSGEPVFCSDISGNLDAYLFIFTGGDFFPTNEYVLSSIRRGRSYEKMLQNDEPSVDLKAQVNQGEIFDRLRSRGLEIYRSDGQLSGFYKKLEYEEMLKIALRAHYGHEDFLSIYVSASFDHNPILYIKKSLPPYYYSYEPAFNEAKRFFGTDEITLTRYYFLGVWGEYFELRDRNDKQLIIDARAITKSVERDMNGVILPAKLPKVFMKKTPPTQRTKEEWAKSIK